ncbi:hypothetical protein PCE1_000268 [Barthelona sp. PCE]
MLDNENTPTETVEEPIEQLQEVVDSESAQEEQESTEDIEKKDEVPQIRRWKDLPSGIKKMIFLFFVNVILFFFAMWGGFKVMRDGSLAGSKTPTTPSAAVGHISHLQDVTPQSNSSDRLSMFPDNTFGFTPFASPVSDKSIRTRPSSALPKDVEDNLTMRLARKYADSSKSPSNSNYNDILNRLSAADHVFESHGSAVDTPRPKTPFEYEENVLPLIFHDVLRVFSVMEDIFVVREEPVSFDSLISSIASKLPLVSHPRKLILKICGFNDGEYFVKTVDDAKMGTLINTTMSFFVPRVEWTVEERKAARAKHFKKERKRRYAKIKNFLVLRTERAFRDWKKDNHFSGRNMPIDFLMNFKDIDIKKTVKPIDQLYNGVVVKGNEAKDEVTVEVDSKEPRASLFDFLDPNIRNSITQKEERVQQLSNKTESMPLLYQFTDLHKSVLNSIYLNWIIPPHRSAFTDKNGKKIHYFGFIKYKDLKAIIKEKNKYLVRVDKAVQKFISELCECFDTDIMLATNSFLSTEPTLYRISNRSHVALIKTICAGASILGAALGIYYCGVSILGGAVKNMHIRTRSFVSIVFCEACGLFGVILALLFIVKIEIPKKITETVCSNIYTSGYAMLAAGLILGISNLIAGISIGLCGSGLAIADAQNKDHFMLVLVSEIFCSVISIFALITSIVLKRFVDFLRRSYRFQSDVFYINVTDSGLLFFFYFPNFQQCKLTAKIAFPAVFFDYFENTGNERIISVTPDLFRSALVHQQSIEELQLNVNDEDLTLELQYGGEMNGIVRSIIVPQTTFDVALPPVFNDFSHEFFLTNAVFGQIIETFSPVLSSGRNLIASITLTFKNNSIEFYCRAPVSGNVETTAEDTALPLTLRTSILFNSPDISECTLTGAEGLCFWLNYSEIRTIYFSMVDMCEGFCFKCGRGVTEIAPRLFGIGQKDEFDVAFYMSEGDNRQLMQMESGMVSVSATAASLQSQQRQTTRQLDTFTPLGRRRTTEPPRKSQASEMSIVGTYHH